MLPYLQEDFGNPNSLHHYGKVAKQALEKARASIANDLTTTAENLFFTASATEANNWAIKCIAKNLKKHGNHIITSKIEHDAVLNVCHYLEQNEGFEVSYLGVDAEGFISEEALEKAIRPETILISLMHGNNEIGTIQNLMALGLVARRHGVLFHTDAVQTLGKVPLKLDELPIDLLTGSGHKLYGPKGVGLLYANASTQAVLQPLLHGGNQEFGQRSGTENVAACVGLAKALKLATQEMPVTTLQLYGLSQYLIEGIQTLASEAVLNGPKNIQKRVPGNVHFSFAPIEGEALVLRLDLNGIAVSSGSACHSSQLEGSHVVLATGKTPAIAKSTLRFSLGRGTTQAEVDALLSVLPNVLSRCGYFKHHPQSTIHQTIPV